MGFGFELNIKKRIIFTLLFYISIVAFVFIFQRQLQYLPLGNAKKIAKGFQERIITTEDGIEILSWFKAPKNGQKIILYFHGNAGNIGDRSHKFEAFADAGFGVMAVSYRGYFGSQGSPSETGLMNDGKASFGSILDLGYLPKDILLYGESLGSGVAIQLAAKFDVAGVVLEAPYTSITAIAKKSYWFLPVSLLLKDKFESIKFMPQVSAPVIIFHGTLDPVVPISEGKKLFAAAKSTKKFIEVEGLGHLNFPDKFLITELQKFLEK
jgi:fermentation-respiration switch protein FrsA (DUF1100 family)